jgi:hypothetical protein
VIVCREAHHGIPERLIPHGKFQKGGAEKVVLVTLEAVMVM